MLTYRCSLLSVDGNHLKLIGCYGYYDDLQNMEHLGHYLICCKSVVVEVVDDDDYYDAVAVAVVAES